MADRSRTEIRRCRRFGVCIRVETAFTDAAEGGLFEKQCMSEERASYGWEISTFPSFLHEISIVV